MSETNDSKDPIALGPHLVASGGFERLYADGMGLIEEVAAYLDGVGREESRSLSREASFVYATESMRLTTRLMQLASWLLLQRAVNEGEITSEAARLEKQKVKFSPTPEERGGPGWEGLPKTLGNYIAKGDGLFERVQRFDRLERGFVEERAADTSNEGGIADQLARLKAAFGELKR